MTRLAVLGVVTALCGLVAAGVFSPHAAVAVPGLAWLLSAASSQLPAGVAWMHDEGSPLLRSGAYLGWTNGAEGELFLYGEGCEDEEAATEGIQLSGSQGSLDVAPANITYLRRDLDRAHLHPLLRLTVVAERTQAFDRAVLRCRGGQEAQARVAATVLFVPPGTIVGDRIGEGGALIGGLTPFPGLGFVGELRSVAAADALTVHSVEFGPYAATTGTVFAAAGHPAAIESWRWQAISQGSRWQATYPSSPFLPALAPPTLTPWNLGYTSLTGPRSLRVRPARALGLALEQLEVALLIATQDSFRVTPRPRPLLSKLVIQIEQAGQHITLVPAGLAFGWTAQP